MVCRCTQDISEDHHAHGHSVPGNTAYATLVFGHISPAGPVGTEVTPDASLAERAALVRALAQSLCFIAVPYVGHTIVLYTFVNLPDRFMVGYSLLFHGAPSFLLLIVTL